jgi:catechol 2,3-dioxygenase-like lactoylglutathione lyase family enzyme
MTGPAPLPLLGIFHEFSLAVAEVRAGVEFYERLGFVQASTADTYAYPYGVLTDGHLFIGLHQRAGPTPVLTFVRGGVAQSAAALEQAGMKLSVRHTGEEEFNQLGFEAPGGQAVAVLEARTYSPLAPEAGRLSPCGEFAEVSLPVADFAAAQSFWEGCGFVAAAEEDVPYPHLALTSDYLDLSFHRPRLCEQPLLVFRAPDMEARIARLREAGIGFAASPRGMAPGSALLEAPGGACLLLASGD